MLSAARVEPSSPTSRREWRRFRKLLLGLTASQLGGGVAAVVVPVVAVVDLRATPLQLGLVTSAEFIAYAVFGLVAGVYVDRWRRRPIMLVTDAGRAGVVLLVPLLTALGLLQIGHLFLVALVLGVLTFFSDTASQAVVPAIVSRERLLTANSRLQTSVSATQLAGPALGGVLGQAAGAALGLAAAALGFVVSLGCVLWMGSLPETHTEPRRDDGPRQGTVASQVTGGLRYVLGDPILSGVLGTVAHFNFVITAQSALLVVFLLDEVRAPVSLVGLLLSASGVGAVAGALSSRWVSRRLGSGRTLVAAAALGPALGLLTPLAHLDVRLVGFVVGTAALGASAAVMRVVSQSYRQAVVPANLLGRVVAANRMITWGPLPLAALAGGLLGQLIGVRPALVALALLLTAAPAWLLRTPVLRMRCPESFEDGRRRRPEEGSTT